MVEAACLGGLVSRLSTVPYGSPLAWSGLIGDTNQTHEGN